MRCLIAGAMLLAAAAGSSGPEPFLRGYLGGDGTDDCDGIAIDRAGDLYLGCHSDSPDFPRLPAKPAPRSPADMDAVVVKIAARTGRIVWATRTGGSDWDAAGDLAVARDGSVYVLGQTQSRDFPTTPDAVQRRFGGPRRDELDAAGKIVYSTLLGGAQNDEATVLAVDDGTVYVGGTTWSDDFPGRRAAQFGPGGGADGFVARLRPGDPGSLEVVRIGGKGRDPVSALALDAEGNLYVAGATSSEDFPLRNALQSRLGGPLDGYLVKLRPADWSLRFSTYLGGAQLDAIDALALDSGGNPIVSGTTTSPDFPTTPGAFERTLRGSSDAFVAKLDRQGTRLQWATNYVGTAKNSVPYDGGGMAVDAGGRIWITGMTAASDLPARDAFQPSFGGGDMDGFLAAFSADGARLCYGSYAGGSGHDILEGIAIGGGKLYVSGLAASAGLPQQAWRMQAGHGGGPFDAFVIGLDTARISK